MTDDENGAIEQTSTAGEEVGSRQQMRETASCTSRLGGEQTSANSSRRGRGKMAAGEEGSKRQCTWVEEGSKQQLVG